MNLEQISLARQTDMAFKELGEELGTLTSGTLFLQIRNNTIGKFGIRHNPIECIESTGYGPAKGLNASQQRAFRNMAIESLNFKKGWTHGEICFDFRIRQQMLIASAQFESHYNMANVMIRMNQRNTNVYVGSNLDS
ncbi:O-methyltransferase [Paenibacillus terrigena]|uniref:O-methyltransferase n=1 Tax=Paenibacillus terrigena TaxID=369333 RepID=UPI0028D52621|nr:O-methyltransferase [Paenibacillus terrigena]